MTKTWWALAALALMINTGCTGDGPGNGDGNDTNDGNDTDSGTGYQPGTGSLVVNATYMGSEEPCLVNTLENERVGETGSPVMNLDPGPFGFRLGDNTMTTLDGMPFHVASNGDYTVRESVAEVVEGTSPTVVTEELELAPKYRCESFQCDWPYEAGTCDHELDGEEQWIYKDENNVLQGSEKDSFGGQGGDNTELTLVNDILSVSPGDPNTVIVDQFYDPSNLSFGYTSTNDLAQASTTVVCELL